MHFCRPGQVLLNRVPCVPIHSDGQNLSFTLSHSASIWWWKTKRSLQNIHGIVSITYLHFLCIIYSYWSYLLTFSASDMVLFGWLTTFWISSWMMVWVFLLNMFWETRRIKSRWNVFAHRFLFMHTCNVICGCSFLCTTISQRQLKPHYSIQHIIVRQPAPGCKRTKNAHFQLPCSLFTVHCSRSFYLLARYRFLGLWHVCS